MPELGRKPLKAYMRVQVRVDAQMRRVLREAARSAQRQIILLAGNEKLGARVRVLQLQLAQQQLDLWASIGKITEVGLEQSTLAAARLLNEFDQMVFSLANVEFPGWRDSLVQQARQNVQTYIARQSNGISLRQNVYHGGQRSILQLEKLIDSALLTGSSATEIAKIAYDFIRPEVPGGASSAAMRLGRTELNNAFHRETINHWSLNPFVTGMKWNLSSSHPEGDVCDELAHDTHYSGGDPGVFKQGDVPGKPHPQCFCYIIPVTISDDELVRNFKAGKYDSWAESQLAP